MEGDVSVKIDQNEDERDQILLEWTTIRQKNMNEIKLARNMVEGSGVNEEVQNTRGTLVQRRFSPD